MEIEGVKVRLEVSHIQDQRLLERMAERDEAALTELYDRYHRFVYSLAVRIVGSPADAEDVTLDVFWQVWHRARQFDPGRGKMLPWLMTMTRTRAIDRRRSLQRQGRSRKPWRWSSKTRSSPRPIRRNICSLLSDGGASEPPWIRCRRHNAAPSSWFTLRGCHRAKSPGR